MKHKGSYLSGLYRAVDILLEQAEFCYRKGYPLVAENLQNAAKTITWEADEEVTEVQKDLVG